MRSPAFFEKNAILSEMPLDVPYVTTYNRHTDNGEALVSTYGDKVQILKTAGNSKRNGKRLNYQVAHSYMKSGMAGSYSESSYFHTKAEAETFAKKLQTQIANRAAYA
jgi:hypothetical protein